MMIRGFLLLFNVGLNLEQKSCLLLSNSCIRRMVRFNSVRNVKPRRSRRPTRSSLRSEPWQFACSFSDHPGMHYHASDIFHSCAFALESCFFACAPFTFSFRPVIFSRSPQHVNVTTIDAIVAASLHMRRDPLARIDVIKLDIEGFEARALFGAMRLLDQVHCHLYQMR
jgi:hypothetical protein